MRSLHDLGEVLITDPRVDAFDVCSQSILKNYFFEGTTFIETHPERVLHPQHIDHPKDWSCSSAGSSTLSSSSDAISSPSLGLCLSEGLASGIF